jgi:hypothetical protein
MREEYGHSKKWFKRTHIANIFLLALAVATLLVGNYLILGILAVLVPLFILGARVLFTHHYEIAEQMRRLVLLMDSLEIKPSQAEIAQFAAEIGKGKVKVIDFVPPYYDSKLPVGYNRLAENIAESAYFTKFQSRSAWMTFGLVCALGVLVVVLLLFVTTSALNIQNKEIIARILITLAVFFSAGDFFWIAIQFHRLHSACESIFARGDKMRNDKDLQPEEVYQLMQDYNCALIQAPPIPDWIYGSWIGRLNASWRQELWR